MQWSYVEYLGRQITNLEATQRSSSATLDASMRRLHTDMNHLADTVLDTAQRLEDKLDWLAERAPGEGCHRPAPPKGAAASGTGRRGPPPRERGNSSSAIVPWGAAVDDLKKVKASRGVEPAAERIPSSTLDPPDREQLTGGNSERHILAPRSLEIDKIEELSSASQGRPEGDLDTAISIMPLAPPQTAAGLLDLSTRFVAMDKKLDKISQSMGIMVGVNDGNDDEDRRRLKEKLKVAIEVDMRNNIRFVVSRGEVWMEYIFGICAPNQRMGKRGSR
jgi:hypothetical protein